MTFTFQPWHLVALLVALSATVATALYLNQRDNDERTPPASTSGAGAPGQSVDLTALNDLRTYVDAHPEDTDAVLRLANQMQDAKQFEQAIASYRKYLSKKPGNIDAQVDLGVCYYNIDRYDSAIAVMEDAVRQQPDHQLGNFNLGIVNLRAGNQAAAVEWLKKAESIDPNNIIGQNARRLIEQHGSAPS